MRMSSRLLLSPAMAIVLTAATIAIILLAANVTIANAQQQLTSQSSVIESGKAATTVRSTKDSFRVQVPQGWVIQDVNNTGFTLAAEVLEGFGILAQLCPEEEQQQQQSALTNAGANTTNSSRNTSSNSNSNGCQASQEEVIHIIRYPNLGARLGISSDDIFTFINRATIPNAILAYHMQKLQEVGYRDIQIVNSIDTTINVDNSTGLRNNRIATTIPAKLVEMTYSTNFDPNETRTGYFILTATAATPRNLGVITGYSIFYEGNSTTTAETMSSGSLAPTPRALSATVRQVFDSFEIIAASTDPLTVEITSSDTEGVAPATFEFEANVTGGTEPYTYSWNFGDGSVEIDDEDETVEHTFDIAGTYNVDLTVIDSTGRTVSDSILITIEEPPPLTSVEITSSDTEGVAPATFEFEANVTGGTEPYTYSWNFGDGSVEIDDEDETVEHTFDIAGTYNVDLTVIDSTGRTVSDSILITIEEPAPPSPEPAPPSPEPAPPSPEPEPGPTFPSFSTTEEPF